MQSPAHSPKNYGTSISGQSYSDMQRLIPSRARSGRQGEDQTVIRFRRGLDARSIPAVKFRIQRHVIDRLNQLRRPNVRGVDFGSKADRPVAKRDWAEERRFEEGLQRLRRWVR